MIRVGCTCLSGGLTSKAASTFTSLALETQQPSQRKDDKKYFEILIGWECIW